MHDEPEDFVTRSWRVDAAIVLLAVLTWAALANIWRPALRLELAPVWMILFLAVLPRAVSRLRRSRR